MGISEAERQNIDSVISFLVVILLLGINSTSLHKTKTSFVKKRQEHREIRGKFVDVNVPPLTIPQVR